jgi:hypothetical protein
MRETKNIYRSLVERPVGKQPVERLGKNMEQY